jgi:hypothetical protein
MNNTIRKYALSIAARRRFVAALQALAADARFSKADRTIFARHAEQWQRTLPRKK